MYSLQDTANDFLSSKAPSLKKTSTILNKVIIKIVTRRDFHKLTSQATNHLCRHLQRQRALSVNKVIKAGSVGKGTALNTLSDLDCVLILNGIESAEALEDRIDDVKISLKECIENINSDTSQWSIAKVHCTRFSVQFIMSSSAGEVDVDLLPTFARNGLAQTYRDMKKDDNETRRFYSAALSEDQVQFIKPLPVRVKDLIRLVKHWRNVFLRPAATTGDFIPNSYLLELVTVYAWEKAGAPHNFQMAEAFKGVLEQLIDHDKLSAIWYKHYQQNQCHDTSIPKVLDPANPYNNVYNIVNCWDKVERASKEAIEKPLLRNLCVSHNWGKKEKKQRIKYS